jgi:tetratricopeptide (TPR) repeat protein
MNFYIGNNPQSDGASAIFPGARTTWWGSYQDAKRMAEEDMSRSLKPSEVSRFWYLQGLKFATREPFAFLGLMAKKFALFWNGNELSNNRDFYFFARGVPLMKPLIWQFIIYFPFGLIAPLAIVGIVLSHREKKRVSILEIFLLVYMLSIILFFVTARYRVPLIPLFILFSAYALDRLTSFVRQRRSSQLVKHAALFLIAFILVNLRIPGYSSANPGQAYYTLGVIYSDRGDKQKAAEQLERALSHNPGISEAYVNLGSIYGDRGEHQLALEYYQMALQKGADSAFVFYNIGIEYHNQGMLDLALENYELSLSKREDDPQVHFLLGEIYRRKEMLDQALDQYEKTIRLDPLHAVAFHRLGTIYHRLGKTEEAISNLERFVQLWQGDPSQKEKVERLLEELRKEREP